MEAAVKKRKYTVKEVPTPPGLMSPKEFAEKHGIKFTNMLPMVSKFKLCRARINGRVFVSEKEALGVINSLNDRELTRVEVEHFYRMGYEPEFIAEILKISRVHVERELDHLGFRRRNKDMQGIVDKYTEEKE